MDREIFASMMETLAKEPPGMEEFERFTRNIYDAVPGGQRDLFIMTAISELMELGIEITNGMRGRGSRRDIRLSILEEMADTMMTVNLMKHLVNITDEDLRRAMEIKAVRYVSDNGTKAVYDPELHGEGMFEAFHAYEALKNEKDSGGKDPVPEGYSFDDSM